MEIINEEILMAQERLSRVNVDFLEFVEKNPMALKRSNFSRLVEFDKGYRNIQPWPIFISRQVKNRFQKASTEIFNLIRQIPERFFGNNTEKISNFLGFPEEYIQLQMESIKGGHLDHLLARGDFVISSTGLKCIEFNVSACLGGWQVPILEELYLNNPIIARFLQEYQVKIYRSNQHEIFFRNLLKPAKKKFTRQNNRELNIAIALPKYIKEEAIDQTEADFNRAYQQVLKEQTPGWHGRVDICDFDYFTIDNDCIFFNGKQVHILVEWYHGVVPNNIFYISLVGNVLMYNGPITSLLTNKFLLALLSEHEDSDVFTAAEQEIIKKHIPWTRRLVPGQIRYGTKAFDLEEFLANNREKLVIKPDRELGGKDIYVGKYTPAAQWEEAVGQAMGDKTRNWVVQEYIESFPHLFQYGEEGYVEHQTIWGLFVFGSQYAGGFLRLMPMNEKMSGVINSQRGAEKTVIFETSE